jgi:uncharacterized membrane protein YkoI
MRIVFTIFFLICLSFAHTANAKRAPLSKEQAVQMAQRAFNGKVLAVKQHKNDKQSMYAVKILNKKGRIRTIRINAETGKLIEP